MDQVNCTSDKRDYLGDPMLESEAEREARLRQLAGKLSFTLDKQGARFTLSRDIDVPAPVRHDDLTLDQVEDVLNTWKLRGPHGG